MTTGSSLTDTVFADDGTPLPFTWMDAEAAGATWEREHEHWPKPLTPMELWFYEHGQTGADRAWAECGLVPPPEFRRWQFVGPLVYSRTTPAPEPLNTEIGVALARVAREYLGPLNFWRGFCKPRIESVIDRTSNISPSWTFQEAAEEWGYGWHQTFTSAAVISISMWRLQQIVGEVFDEGKAVVLDLIGGGENPTQAIDDHIWDLAKLAGGSLARTLLRAGEPIERLREVPGAEPFLERFAGFVEAHRDRAVDWCFTSPTWGEQPEVILDLIRARLNSGTNSPAASRHAAAARRRELLAAVLERVEPSRHDALRKQLERLSGYVTIREERAYLQMALSGRTRRRLLEYADSLVRGGRLEQREDILFLTPEDIEGGGQLQAAVARARQEWHRWAGLAAPPFIGAPSAETAGPQGSENEIVGRAGSRGIVTGPARVIDDPYDFAAMEPGDILVCVMTTPAWTPLFGMAGGVVTETGGASSHPAITAREYGIPCVLSAVGAVTRIRTGQTITVDGDRGIVGLTG